jgi:hypothetical protein
MSNAHNISQTRNFRNADARATQQGTILRLLIAAHGDWVPLPEITACAAQYNARIFSLRRLGFRIENRSEQIDGVRHSWFRLVRGQEQSARAAEPDRRSKAREWLAVARGKATPPGDTGSLFGDLEPQRRYQD